MRGTKTPVKVVFSEETQVTARGNLGHVQQIVMNLVQNAIDLLGEAQKLQVTLYYEERRDCAVLIDSDNGPGIAEDIAGAVIDPFFTTKSVGKGTGLGLSISGKIAQEHAGDLKYYRTKEGGSCLCQELTTGKDR